MLIADSGSVTRTYTPPPEPVQKQDVHDAVDRTISPQATPAQRDAAYTAVQERVNTAASGGDYQTFDFPALQSIAFEVLQDQGAPTKFDPRVIAAVDREIDPKATAQQRFDGYQALQTYVDQVGGISDQGITEEALPAQATALLQNDCTPTVAGKAAVDAQNILEVGKRDGEDDYGARRDALAAALKDATPAYREHLMDSLLKNDAGALKSWLKVPDVIHMRDDGKIDAASFSTIADQTAKAYNAGELDKDSFHSLYDIDYGPDQVREYDQLQQFLGASGSDDMARLRGSLSQDIFDEWNASPYPTDNGYHSYNMRQLTLAMQDASGDPGHPEVLTQMLSRMEGKDFDKLIAVAAQLPDNEPDLMATIFGTVANDPSTQAGELAARLARLPGEHSDWFEQGQVSRNEALSSMLDQHTNAVLDALSEYDDSGARGLGDDTDRKQYEVNGRDLAAVLELTAFNPDISTDARTASHSAILDYAGAQARAVDQSRGETNSAGYLEASGRLVVLSAASDVAVDRGYEKLQADIDAKKEAIGFAVDLALTVVPLGSRLSAAADGGIEKLFADNPLVKEAVSGLSGQVIDKVTGQLTDQAKAQIYAKVDDSDSDLGKLLERQTVADAFRESILGAVSDERDRADIQRDANGLADDISEID